MLETILVVLFVLMAVAKLTAFIPILTWLAVCVPLLTIVGHGLWKSLCVVAWEWMHPLPPVGRDRF